MKIGLDIGTSKICLVVVENDKCLFSVEEKNFFDRDKEQDADRILKACLNLIDKAKLQGYDVAVAGVSTQMHGILYVDKSGNAVSNLYTWQDEKGNRKYNGEYTYAEYAKVTTGYNVSSGYGLITHFYLLKNNSVPQSADKIYTIGDYVYMKLNSLTETAMHPTNAASLGFYDIDKNCFDRSALSKLGIDCEILPKVSYSSSVIGDNQASFIGAVGNTDNALLVNIGTGGQVSMLVDKSTKLKTGEIRPFDSKYNLAVGSSLCGGYAYAIMGKFIKSVLNSANVQDYDIFEIMNKLAKEETAMQFETAFNGSREDATRTARITNITEENFTASDMVTACIEGIVKELKTYYDDFGILADNIVGAGGGIKKNINMQKAIERIFGKSLILSKYEQDAAIGVAKRI